MRNGSEISNKTAYFYRIRIEIGRNVLTGHRGHSSAPLQRSVVNDKACVCTPQSFPNVTDAFTVGLKM